MRGSIIHTYVYPVYRIKDTVVHDRQTYRDPGNRYYYYNYNYYCSCSHLVGLVRYFCSKAGRGKARDSFFTSLG